jgi:AraC-like DNA-binding protein
MAASARSRPPRSKPSRSNWSVSGDTDCIRHAALFQEPLIEDPPRRDAPAETRRRYRRLVDKARHICAECPLRVECLYAAVVSHDVAGVVAGTTERQRCAIRHELGIAVDPENFDRLAGIATPGRPVDHNEVIRLHRANPGESLDSIAGRLGCSPSTIKRHLRQERTQTPGMHNWQTQRTTTAVRPPTRKQVLAAADRVLATMPTNRFTSPR